MTTTSAPAQLKPIQRYGLAIGALVFLLPFLLDIPGLDEPGERMLSIFLLAIVFWITEAIEMLASPSTRVIWANTPGIRYSRYAFGSV